MEKKSPIGKEEKNHQGIVHCCNKTPGHETLPLRYHGYQDGEVRPQELDAGKEKDEPAQNNDNAEQQDTKTFTSRKKRSFQGYGIHSSGLVVYPIISDGRNPARRSDHMENRPVALAKKGFQHSLRSDMSRTVLMTAGIPKYSVILLLISTGIVDPSFLFITRSYSM